MAVGARWRPEVGRTVELIVDLGDERFVVVSDASEPTVEEVRDWYSDEVLDAAAFAARLAPGDWSLLGVALVEHAEGRAPATVRLRGVEVLAAEEVVRHAA